MTTGRDDRYVRLLRWYPRAWRDAHGAVFLDTLREQSEHEGRTQPSRSESFAAMVNGLGNRLDTRLASRLALAGIALTAVPKSITIALVVRGRTDLFWDALIAVDFGVTAVLVLTGVVALVRALGLVTAGRALCVLALAWPACALASLAQYAWVLGFNAADSDIDVTGPGVYSVGAAGPATAWAMLSAFAGGALAAVAAWFMAEGVLGRTRLGRLPRFGLATVAAAVAAPAAGTAVVFPMGWMGVALGVVFLAMRSVGTWRSPERQIATGGVPTRPLVRALAGSSAGIGLLGIVYAVTGTGWSPAATDETLAWAQGITILLCAALPLVLALGFFASGRGHSPLNVWGPLGLLGAVIGTVIYAYSDSPDSRRMEPALTLGSAALGIAAAWWVLGRFRGSRGDRSVAGAAIALGCVAFQGAYVLPLAVFVAPFIAALLAIRGDVRLHRAHNARPADAPVADT